ncbi:MAG: DUF3494 domain-containing protein [Balneolaceae bacterium]|nr:DUF3494 domain-containing protein [Balneolaceae bacterium]
MNIQKNCNPLTAIGLIFLVSLMSSCSDKLVGVEGFCPLVESTSPINLETEVAGNKVVTVTFEEKINPATMIPAAFILTTVVADTSAGAPLSQTVEVNGTMTYSNDTNTMTFTPSAPLGSNTVYTGRVKNTIEDPMGNRMLEDYVWSFTTETQSAFTLNVAAENGSVEKDPDQQSYEDGTEVVLTATPAEGYQFTSWSGDASGSDNPLTVTMDSNKSITANFTAITAGTYTLNITASNGSVEKDPDQQSYEAGSQVVLTAIPADGYVFSSWSGDASGSNNPLTVTMDSNKNITANFTAIDADTFTLSVTAENGSVNIDPDQQSYDDGDEVLLTSTAYDCYEFTSWSGDASGSDNPLTVIMESNKNITANFTATDADADTFTLNVTAENGSVNIDPDQQSYDDGDEVVLTATPDDGYEFSSWSGDASGSDNPLTVIMDDDKEITANFSADEVVPPSVNLGDASRFGAFGGNAGVTNQGINTVINGSIGTTAASTLITGFHDELTGDIYTETTLNVGAVTNGIFTAPPAPGTATSQQIAEDALADATAARNSISPGSLPGGIDLGTDELGGLTLEPGVYKSASGSYAISDVDLTLDAQGDANATWIFQVESSLTVGTPTGPRNIIMTNGALPENVFWYVGSAATINGAGGGTMVGTILSDAGVTFSTAGNVEQTVLNGRAISLTASVTMVNTTINVPE